MWQFTREEAPGRTNRLHRGFLLGGDLPGSLKLPGRFSRQKLGIDNKQQSWYHIFTDFNKIQ